MTAVLFNPVTLLLAIMCVQWVELASAGPFSVKLPYVAIGLLITYAAIGRRKLGASLLFVRQNAIWLAPLALYLLILAVVLQGSEGQNIAPRQIFYLVGSAALAGCLATTRRIRPILRIGSALGILLFVIAVEVIARGLGLSWVDAVDQFIRSGNLQFVTYKFLRAVFNALDPTGEITLGAATKNGIAVCMLIAGLLFRSASAKSRDWVGMGFLGLVLLLLLLLNTRSVMIAAAASLLIATAIGAMMRPAHSLAPLLLKVAALVGVLVLAVAMSVSEQAVSTTVSDRFSFEDLSAGSRLEQYQEAISKVEQDPLFGSGYYEVDGHSIHNLFLSAWVHAGLAAFLLVVLFYVALLLRWLALIASVIMRPDRWVLPIAFEWIAPLPLMPLFRVWLSGDAGHMFLGEWIAVSAFLGCVLANQLRRRRMAAFRVAPPAGGVARAAAFAGPSPRPTFSAS